MLPAVITARRNCRRPGDTFIRLLTFRTSSRAIVGEGSCLVRDPVNPTVCELRADTPARASIHPPSACVVVKPLFRAGGRIVSCCVDRWRGLPAMASSWALVEYTAGSRLSCCFDLLVCRSWLSASRACRPEGDSVRPVEPRPSPARACRPCYDGIDLTTRRCRQSPFPCPPSATRVRHARVILPMLNPAALYLPVGSCPLRGIGGVSSGELCSSSLPAGTPITVDPA